GSNRYGAFVHNYYWLARSPGRGLSNGAGSHFDVAHVGRTVRSLGGSHSDKDELGIFEGFFIARGKAEPSSLLVALEHFLQARFLNRRYARFQLLYLFRGYVHAPDFVSQVGKASSGHQADVASPYYSDVTQRIPP